MVAKSTSGSGFHFRFVFNALDVVENEYNIDRVPLDIFLDIWGQSLLSFCGHCGLLPLCQNLDIFIYK